MKLAAKILLASLCLLAVLLRAGTLYTVETDSAGVVVTPLTFFSANAASFPGGGGGVSPSVSNSFWLNSSNLVYQGTNALATGAFTPSNTVWIASSNLVYQGTNALTTGAFTPSNTAWANSSNLVYQGTNALTTGAFTPSNTAWANSSNLVQQATNATVKAAGQFWGKFQYVNADLTMFGTEGPVIGLTGNHKLSLPGQSTNFSKSWIIICVGASGTNAIFQPNGSTIFITNTAPGRATWVYCDGTNHWAVSHW